ncbi:MAG: FAD-binding oxidoreductase [Actinomycetales bacterium]|nr:FAD-binding oxidoreductase [Actinomycetales bacterium]
MSRAGSSGLPGSARVVVIGGGVIGTSIAFHLAEAGVDGVLLLEQGSLAGGSTSKAAGGVRAQFSDPVNIALGLRSLRAFEDFDRRPGQQIDLHQPGYLFLLRTEDEVEAYQASIRLQNSMGVASRMLSAKQAAGLTPAIDPGSILAAAFHARDGYCSPESVTQGYASGARRHGATIRTGVTVTGIDTRGGEVTGVRTDDGLVRTGTVICAAGAWSMQVAQWAGVTLPVVPLRRQILISEPLPAALEKEFPARMPMTIDAGTTLYAHREGPGLLMGMSYAGEEPGFRWDYSDAWTDDLTDAMQRCLPALLDVGIAHRWVGMYEVTPDHNALIGESSTTSRFLYACGFSGHGFLQGPAIGEVIRDLFMHRTPDVDVSAFTGDRFAAGNRLMERNIV